MLTETQLALRKNRITGSTVAAYLGLNPWQPPSEAWRINAGLAEFNGNRATEIGEMIEPCLMQLAAKEIGSLACIYPCDTILHPEHGEWWAATPDMMYPTLRLGVQIKNSGAHMASGYLGKPGEYGPCDNDLIPAYHLLQCQWEMGVTGYPEWRLAVYFGGADFRLYHLQVNDLLLERVALAARRFWERHLDPNGPQMEPDDTAWIGNRRARNRPAKLKGDALIYAPIGGSNVPQG